ncbi:MAG TPA: ActS/PrrB/RegB family redox-sensitive histidine kinase [Rhizomicrobium sp.]|nr:ActS/PrrB/RegB family redox-sensitive histidine kinase [Rhizomicrobium sp.]
MAEIADDAPRGWWPRLWRNVWPRLWREADAALARTPTRGRVRLRTLTNLRWLAVAGQSATLFVVYFGLAWRLPIVPCALAIAASVLINVALAFLYPPAQRLTNREATVHLAFDVLQLGCLLYFTGGIENPFALMFLAPVVIAAATLNLGNTLLLAALALASISVIAVVHQPLPWDGNERLTLPALYLGGIWSSLVIGIGFTSIYAWRIASESARMQAGLAATQLALSREHRLASLGALATAAAHELGTPLGTIAVVARELERALPAGTPESDDARLLRAEAERCRTILTRLARPDEAGLRQTDHLPLGALLDEIAGPYRSDEVAITVELSEDDEPKAWRTPELVHGLANVISNAADFAASRVWVRAAWDESDLRISVEDDGPGFALEILERIGEPYVTSRPGTYALGETELSPDDTFTGQQGMGLGFFIAKTLLERTGGRVRARNSERGGARVSVRWPRGAIDGESPPAGVSD